MPDNLTFGGGASASSMTLVVLLATLLASVLVLFLPRKYAVAPILVAVFLTPVGQQILVGGFHLYVMRFIILAGSIRLLAVKVFARKPLFPGGLNSIDKAFCLWAFARGLAAMLLFRQGGAVVNQVAFWLDAFGTYFIFRHFLQDGEDVLRATKQFAHVAVILAACMLFEYMTRVNLFSYINSFVIVPWIRNGSVRAQGVSANSITAGAIGATLLPLFFWLWKSGKAKLWGTIGLAASTIISLTSLASTPITGFLAGILALCLWLIRRHMRVIRWGIVFAVLGLAMVMKAPVWFVITKINVAGGDSWDRANLLDQTVRHFSDWWLWGTKDNVNWGDFTWDQCNQFAAEGLQGGLATLILFLVVLYLAFSRIGKSRKLLEGKPEEWFFWCLGAALFAHVIVFMGIDYFDQTRTLWFIFLAMISAATFPILAAQTSTAVEVDLVPGVPRLSFARPASPSAARPAGPPRVEQAKSHSGSNGGRFRELGKMEKL